ncbi:protein phosphatase 1, regulatory (inhibitor) subunit 14Aa isoform X1 [Brachyhypopomus gauderio]|uniref:protein phosphatase 1, regulatory (inhibitor) subunit 14Aa isoform X1 n=1 Tax=Brachyhypopomus gauderio TaxID=698409 RepID=UPI004040FB09
MSEDLYVLRCEDHDPRPRERGASVQKRQARVTVKYNRKELQKRLNVEKWIEDTLETLYIGAEDEMPEEVDIDGLLVLHSDQERAQKLQEVLHTCKNSTQGVVARCVGAWQCSVWWGRGCTLCVVGAWLRCVCGGAGLHSVYVMAWLHSVMAWHWSHTLN